MSIAIADTSTLLFLHRVEVINVLEVLFDRVLVPDAVVSEILIAEHLGYSVPALRSYSWLVEVTPHKAPSEWLALDLGPGELGVMAMALENPDHIALLDDGLARRVAHAAGLRVWGTLRVLLEAKFAGEIQAITPLVDCLVESGMWLSDEMRDRILTLAGEARRPLSDLS